MKTFKPHLAAAVVSISGFLLYQFISSFATLAQVYGVEAKIQDQSHLVNQRIDRLDGKIDRLIHGMCIIDRRTCKIN